VEEPAPAEAAAAAESFRHEARQLVEAVGRFKTDRGDERGRVIALVKEAAEHVRRVGVKRRSNITSTAAIAPASRHMRQSISRGCAG